jgi:hypothetical protein
MRLAVWMWFAALVCVFGLSGPAGAQEAGVAARAASSQFPDLPLRRDEGSMNGGAIAWLLVAIAAAVAASLYWRRRSMGTIPQRPSVVVLPARSLTTHATLHVIEWERERVLVATTSQSVTVISRQPIDAAASPQQTGTP